MKFLILFPVIASVVATAVFDIPPNTEVPVLVAAIIELLVIDTAPEAPLFKIPYKTEAAVPYELTF